MSSLREVFESPWFKLIGYVLTAIFSTMALTSAAWQFWVVNPKDLLLAEKAGRISELSDSSKILREELFAYESKCDQKTTRAVEASEKSFGKEIKKLEQELNTFKTNAENNREIVLDTKNSIGKLESSNKGLSNELQACRSALSKTNIQSQLLSEIQDLKQQKNFYLNKRYEYGKEVQRISPDMASYIASCTYSKNEIVNDCTKANELKFHYEKLKKEIEFCVERINKIDDQIILFQNRM
jgi:uncharacterized coiled-coil DUF342 family protein